MSPEQIRELANDPLFTVGSHTCDHPFLPRCTPHEATRQIAENKAWLEATSGAACELFSYPHGAFTESLAETCHRLGFRFAFSVERTELPVTDMSMPRVGVYKPSTAVLHFKAACGGALYSKPIAHLRSGLRAPTAAAAMLLQGTRSWLHPAPAAKRGENGAESN
jgi:peptidoglycan/xylan/chitin deacetylase (PgdA/CDA1 family)